MRHNQRSRQLWLAAPPNIPNCVHARLPYLSADNQQRILSYYWRKRRQS